MATLEDMVEHCESCGEELDIGQIGECDDCQAEREDARVVFAPPNREAGRQQG